MSQPSYRHTQVGWVILGTMVPVMGLIGLALVRTTGTVAIVVEVSLAALTLLFGWLTVEVDGETLRARFGIGLVGKTVALADVRTFSSVRNPWYWGWGIRLYPGGTLYNVSGAEAVEIVLNDGRRFRVGTDEPTKLAGAIQRVVGEPLPVAPGEPAARPRLVSKLVFIAVLAVALLAAGAGAFAVFGMGGPPTVTVTATGVSVKGALYGVDAPFDQVTSVTLDPSLPRVLRRTNGYASGGTLRGHFDLDGLGKGQLFVEKAHPPFIHVQTSSGCFFLNDENPARTEALYQELKDAWTRVHQH